MVFTWEALAADDRVCKRPPEDFDPWLFIAKDPLQGKRDGAASPNPPGLYGKLRHRSPPNPLRGFDYTFDGKSAVCKSRSTSGNTLSQKTEGSMELC